jgi:hypothetical protein
MNYAALFICSLFDGDVSNSRPYNVKWLDENELEINEKKVLWLDLRYYHRVYLEGVNKIMKNLSQDSQRPSRDIKRSFA